MIFRDLNNLASKNINTIIVGSGPAGITVAKKLEKKKISTLIIEAGPMQSSSESQEEYEGQIIGDKYVDISASRLRQFGGTSNHWSGVCHPMEEHDFANWPIKKIDLDIYTKEAMKILNLSGNFNVNKFNEDFNIITTKQSDVNFAKKYYKQIKISKYINLIANCTLQDLNFKNNQIKSIEVYKNKKKHTLKSKFYVLACGALENSRILLWNNYKKNLFDSDMPIGKYFHDHPTHDVAEGILDLEKTYKFIYKNNLEKNLDPKCDPWLYLAPNQAFIKKNLILNNRVDIYYQRYKSSNDYSSKIYKKLVCAAPNYVSKYLKKFPNQLPVRIESHLEQNLDPKNKVVLNFNKKDSMGIPTIKLYWSRSKIIRDTSKKTLLTLAKFFTKENIGRLAIKNFLFNDDYYQDQGGYHHMGGTCMGHTAKSSVVDKNLKVHNIENLYIAGSSVFKTGGYTNPTFTIVQLSLRLGDEIVKKNEI
jgi:hypothetical protein